MKEIDEAMSKIEEEQEQLDILKDERMLEMALLEKQKKVLVYAESKKKKKKKNKKKKKRQKWDSNDNDYDYDDDDDASYLPHDHPQHKCVPGLNNTCYYMSHLVFVTIQVFVVMRQMIQIIIRLLLHHVKNAKIIQVILASH